MPTDPLDAPTLADWLGDDFEGIPDERGPVRLPRLILSERAGAGVDLTIGDLLGEGGMASVHRARQVALDRDVAVKRTHDPANHRAVAGLLKEAVIGARIEHPNVVPIHFVGETAEGEPVVVMRAVGGVPWDELLVQEPVTGSDLGRHLEIFYAVCRAVSYAHAQGYLHRDIKPDNVRIGEFGEVYLLDWGIAAALSDARAPAAGTPSYMAPEMATPGKPDIRSDVYGLGATLLHVLIGHRPQRTPSQAGFTPGTAPDEEPEPLEIPTDLPAGLHQIVARACAPLPSQRYPTVDELRTDLQTWHDDRAVLALARAADARRDDFFAPARPHEARERFAVARFAYEQVLEVRLEHQDALEGLASIFDHMVRLEADQGDVDAALALLEAHPGPSAELHSHVRDAHSHQAAHEAESKRLEFVARVHDLGDVRRALAWIMTAVMASGFATVISVNVFLGSAAELEQSRIRLVLVVVPVWISAVVAAAVHWSTLRSSPAGKRVIVSVIGFITLLVTARFLTGALQIDAAAGVPAVVLYEPGAITGMALGFVAFSRHLLLPAVFCAVMWLVVGVSLASPHIAMIFNVAVLSSLAAVTVGWWRALGENQV